MNSRTAGESRELKATRRGPRETGLAVVGSMLGRSPGHPIGAGEDLAARLVRAGYRVELTSRYRLRLLRLVDIAATLLRHAGSIDVQILQVYSGLSFVLEDVASWLGLRLGQKVVMHVHGGGIPEFMARYPTWTCRVLRRASAIVAPSMFLARALGEYGFAVRVIPNAVDLPIYPYRHRRRLSPRLLWMRTFHPLYNPEMAVRVLARVKRAHPRATLVMAGQDKGIESDVRRLARTFGVEEAIRFPGFLDVESKMREASAADIFLNTNHVDNTPISVIEACAMGLPVVASKVGGICDLLTHRETALLVPDGDDEAMAAAVVQLLEQPEMAASLSASGRDMAVRLSWDQTRPQWEELIAEVTSGLDLRRRDDTTK
jgi:L-malate glycosyltransferase